MSLRTRAGPVELTFDVEGKEVDLEESLVRSSILLLASFRVGKERPVALDSRRRDRERLVQDADRLGVPALVEDQRLLELMLEIQQLVRAQKRGRSF